MKTQKKDTERHFKLKNQILCINTWNTLPSTHLERLPVYLNFFAAQNILGTLFSNLHLNHIFFCPPPTEGVGAYIHHMFFCPLPQKGTSYLNKVSRLDDAISDEIKEGAIL